MATKSTYRINAVEGSGTSIYFWQITNILTGRIDMFPVNKTDFTLVVNPDPVTGSITVTSDYNFIWKKDELNQININVINVKYIGGSSSAPNYNSPSTDLASILALI